MHWSNSQIRDGLAKTLASIYGCREPLRAGKRLCELADWAEIDWSDIAFRLQRQFRFQASDAEWAEFLGFEKPRSTADWEREFGPRLTVDGLTEFICAKLERDS